MNEYIIRTAAHHEWPALHRDRAVEVLSPAGFECHPEEGWGDVRLRCGNVVVSYSGEEVGWQVSFDGDLLGLDTDHFIDAVTRRLETEVGEPCEWVRIS